MEIRFYCGSEEEGSVEILSKLKSEQKFLELFETKRIKSVSVIYEKEPVHRECTSSNI